MVIYFKSQKLKKVCSNQKEMIRLKGALMAKILQRRLSELDAAGSLAEIEKLPQVRLHQLTGDRKGQLSVNLNHPYRLLFVPAHDSLPCLKDGGMNYSEIKSILIIEIADTH